MIVRKGLPRTLKLRILQEVNIEGKTAFPGDVWTVPVTDAIGLIDWGQAERIVEEGVIEVRAKIEIYANSRDDEPAMLISRFPESERPPRTGIPISPNLQTGQVLTDAMLMGRRR